MKDVRKKPRKRALPLWQTLGNKCPDSIKNRIKSAQSALVSLGTRVCTFMEEVDACAPQSNPYSIWRVLLRLQRIPRRVRQIARELHHNRFPESNRLLVQLFFFIWGAVPIFTTTVSRHAVKIHHRLTAPLRSTAKTANVRKPWQVAAFLSVSGVAAGLALFFSLYTMGATVQYGDIHAVVASEAVVEEIIAEVEEATSVALGETFTIDETQVEYTSELILRADIVEPEVVKEEVSDAIGLVQEGYCLYIDGDFIGATLYEGALEELLAQLKADVIDEDTISCDFAEEVEIRKEYVQDEQIVNLGHVAELLYSTKAGEVTYTVVSGDTWSKIASAHDLTSDALLAMNPGYDVDKLSIGEVLTISTAVPYLTVTVQQREHYVAQVPYTIEYTDSDTMYQGDYKVTSAGANGTADTVANVTYVNGVEVSRTILSSANLQDPVTEQRLQGTLERPSWMATGSFRWPTSGTITSYFGYRSAFSGASTYHQGLDIANGYGTAIYAADGGTVVYAGWQSGYGYLVEIDHGNGYTTRYGHNSSLLVSVGDKVYKGQQISKMGSTGVSSGNHCHFEIRYNGVAKNPLSYLP